MSSEQIAVDLPALRLGRLREVMRSMGTEALLTADPINISYACGVRNMNVFAMMGAARFVLVVADGPVVLWEFGGSEHLAASSTTITEVRTAPSVTPLAGSSYLESIDAFANELVDTCAPYLSGGLDLAVERFDHPVTDALRAAGFSIGSATDVFVRSRLIKLPEEIAVIRDAVQRVEAGVEVMRAEIRPGSSEVEVWAHFHRHLVAHDGEYVSTRLAQAGSRTFPYFQEAGAHLLANGDLFCIDTDAIGVGGYGVDLSRTYLCGDRPASIRQVELHQVSLEQLEHNSSLLGPGVGFGEFARDAWPIPARFAPHGYYCLAHGLGMSGEYPYVPVDSSTPLDGGFEPGMVICVESYIGDQASHQGVKLEDQFLITDHGTERLTTTPFDPRLMPT